MRNSKISQKLSKMWTKNALLGYFRARVLKKFCHIWNQHPQVFLISKFCKKTKIPKFVPKNALFGYFWGGIFKSCSRILNHQPQICLIVKFCKKTKCYKFQDEKCFLRLILDWNFKKLFSYVKSAPSIRSNCKVFSKNNWLNFWPKMPYFGIIGVKLWKMIFIFETASSNLSNCKISSKNKNA